MSYWTGEEPDLTESGQQWPYYLPEEWGKDATSPVANDGTD